MVKQQQLGFTLIEMMIVVAIIGVLSAIAIPSYNEYVARAQATEGVVMLGALRQPISEYWEINGEYPEYAAVNGLGAQSQEGTYLFTIGDGVQVGRYQAVFNSGKKVNAKLSNKTIVLIYDGAQGTFAWSCVMIEERIRPSVCK